MNLKKMERYLRVNLLGPGLVLWKKNLPGRGLTKVEKHWHRRHLYIIWIIIRKIILSAEQKGEALQETLRRKEAEFQVLEGRYKKYIEKAKSVINSLDPKQNSGTTEVAVLRDQLIEKHKIIEVLEVSCCVL